MSTKTTNRYYSFRLYNYSEYQVPALAVWTNRTVKAVDSLTGVDMPNYKTVIKQGGNAVNNLSAVRQRITYRRGLVTSTTRSTPNGPNKSAWSDALEPIPYVNTRAIDASLQAKADNLARIEVIKKIRSENDGFNGPVVLGELAETIHWIKSPAQTLRIALYTFLESHERKLGRLNDQMRMTQIKRNRRKLLDRYSKDLADNFMEFTFAVRPLIGTIKDIAEAALYKLPRTSLKRLSASIPQESSTIAVAGFQDVASSQSWATAYDITKVDRVLVNYVVWYKEEIPHIESQLRRVIDSGGFRVSDVPMVAWELFPLSWFYDYFVNIGDLLACNFDYNAKVAFCKRAVTSDVIDYVSSYKFKKTGVNVTWIAGGTKAPYMLSHTRSFVRTKLADLGNFTPSIRFELPGTTSQFLNTAGLARQKFDKVFNLWRTVKI